MPPFGVKRGTRPHHKRKSRVTLRKVNKKVNKILSSQEKKFFLGDISFVFPVAGVGLVTWLTAVTLGDDNNEREGEVISGVRFEMKYNFSLSAASVHSFETVRVILFEEKVNSNQALPGAAQLLSSINPYSYMNRSTGRNRFRIIYDRTHVINRFVTDLDSVSQTYSVSLKMNGRKIKFDSNAIVPATGVGGANNHIFLLAISDAAANPANFEGASQYTYKDT